MACSLYKQLSTFLFIQLPTFLFIQLPTFLFIQLPTFLFIQLPTFLSVPWQCFFIQSRHLPVSWINVTGFTGQCKLQHEISAWPSAFFHRMKLVRTAGQNARQTVPSLPRSIPATPQAIPRSFLIVVSERVYHIPLYSHLYPALTRLPHAELPT